MQSEYLKEYRKHYTSIRYKRQQFQILIYRQFCCLAGFTQTVNRNSREKHLLQYLIYDQFRQLAGLNNEIKLKAIKKWQKNHRDIHLIYKQLYRLCNFSIENHLKHLIYDQLRYLFKKENI